MGSHPSFLDPLQERLRKPLLSARPEALARAEAFLSSARRPCLRFDSQSVYRWFSVRYYPDPSEPAAVPPPASMRCVGSYETALRFTQSVSYPEGEAWESVMASEDPAVQEAWSECHDEVEEALGVNAGGHRIGGYKTWTLEDTPFKPPTGFSDRMQDYELLLRLDFDNAADFAWGSNVVYVLVQRDDLAAGRLDRAFDLPANA